MRKLKFGHYNIFGKLPIILEYNGKLLLLYLSKFGRDSIRIQRHWKLIGRLNQMKPNDRSIKSQEDHDHMTCKSSRFWSTFGSSLCVPGATHPYFYTAIPYMSPYASQKVCPNF